MSRECEVWITAEDHQRLMAHLYADDGEHGAILHAGIVHTDRGLRLLVRTVNLAIDGKHYVPGEYGHRALTPAFIHSNIIACRNERLAYLAVHNHGPGSSVAFSAIDMASHLRGYPALLDIGKGVPVGALVYGGRAVQSDVWTPDGGRFGLREYRVIGSSIDRLYPFPRSNVRADPALDRQIRMFGNKGQALLGEAKVAIVGLGGVGSLLTEYLSRLGVGHLVLVDPDVIEETNLSRVVGATLNDVRRNLRKTAIAARVAQAAQPRIRITQIPADVVYCSVSAQLKDCDFIFLAADSMRARLLANAIAHQFFVPVVQAGAKVRAGSDGALIDAMSAVRHVRPSHACLWCNGFIDAGLLAIESKTEEERKAQAYGTEQPNPSVITLNAVAAAGAVNDFLFDFLGVRESTEAPPFRHEHFLRRKIDLVHPRRDEECRECVRRFGRGEALELPCIPDAIPDSQSSAAGPPLRRLWNAIRHPFRGGTHA